LDQSGTWILPLEVVAATQEKIQKILDAGVNAIFTTKGIDDFAMKYLVEAMTFLFFPVLAPAGTACCLISEVSLGSSR